jgi:Reverse transcriptase (RNA-dependent DNA polymerase)
MTTGINVHTRLDQTISDIIVELDQQYEGYRDSKWSIVVQLDRALYGCVESASLWYENLRTTMTGLGYERNPYDNCVFNKTENGVQCTATVNVDDLLIISKSSEMIESLAKGLKDRYGEMED